MLVMLIGSCLVTALAVQLVLLDAQFAGSGGKVASPRNSSSRLSQLAK